MKVLRFFKMLQKQGFHFLKFQLLKTFTSLETHVRLLIVFGIWFWKSIYLLSNFYTSILKMNLYYFLYSSSCFHLFYLEEYHYHDFHDFPYLTRHTSPAGLLGRPSVWPWSSLDTSTCWFANLSVGRLPPSWYNRIDVLWINLLALQYEK